MQWEKIETGVEYRRFTVFSGKSYVRSVLKFVKIDPKVFNMKILTAGQMGRERDFFVRDILKQSKAVLLINGGYFGEDRKPLGFLVSNGKTVNRRIATNWIYSGLLYILKGRPFLIDRREYPKGIQVEQALQAGPRLMADGRPIQGIRNLRIAHFRSGIGLTTDEHILVFATDTKYRGISWRDLQQILSLDSLHCASAMNLDGGGSTQMALKAGGRREFVDGTSKIPVAIGFFRK